MFVDNILYVNEQNLAWGEVRFGLLYLMIVFVFASLGRCYEFHLRNIVVTD